MSSDFILIGETWINLRNVTHIESENKAEQTHGKVWFVGGAHLTVRDRKALATLQAVLQARSQET